MLAGNTIDRVLAHLYADAQTAQLAFEKGEVDSCGVSIPELERFQRLPHSTIVRLPNGTCRFLAANTTKPEFADKRFRQAVAYAIDRPTITKALFKDMFIPIYGPFVQSWAKNPDDNQYPYNPEKAKALLREIGWNASRVVEIVYYYTDAISKSLMETIQQMLVAVGVKTSLRLVPDDPPWEKEVYNEATYDLAFAAQGVPLDPDQATALIDSRKIYPNGVNYSRYKNPRVDQLLDAGRAAAVQSERQKIYQEIDKILNEDLPYIWLWEPAAVTAINKRVVGMAERQAALPNTPPLNEIHKWWIAS